MDNDKKPNDVIETKRIPRIETWSDLKSMLSDLVHETRTGEVNRNVANATANICGKLLKAIDMELKYGKDRVLAALPQPSSQPQLTEPATSPAIEEVRKREIRAAALAKLSDEERRLLLGVA